MKGSDQCLVGSACPVLTTCIRPAGRDNTAAGEPGGRQARPQSDSSGEFRMCPADKRYWQEVAGENLRLYNLIQSNSGARPHHQTSQSHLSLPSIHPSESETDQCFGIICAAATTPLPPSPVRRGSLLKFSTKSPTVNYARPGPTGWSFYSIRRIS